MAEDLIEIGCCGNGATYEVDNRLRFEDGRLFVTKTPYVGDKQSDFQEKVDVTEEVLDMLLKNLEKPKKNFRERYKRIAESDAFKKAHEGMSIGEVIPVEGEEPVSEDLEEEIVKRWKVLHGSGNPTPFDTFNGIARHFAQWQKEKDKKWLSDNHKQIYHNGYEEGFESAWDAAFDEMMKNAIDGEIFDNYDGDICKHHFEVLVDIPEGYKDGDKVKLIFIKED